MTKKNITHLTSLNIQPNIVPLGNNKFDGVHCFYLPLLTTAQRNKIPASELREGALILNVNDPDNHLLQAYCRNDGINPAMWHTVATAPFLGMVFNYTSPNHVTKLTGLDVQPDFDESTKDILYIPVLTIAEMRYIPNTEIRFGAILYNEFDSGMLLIYMRTTGNTSWHVITVV